MSGEHVVITGLDDLLKMLEGSTDKIKKKAIKPALRELAKQVATEAKRNLARHRRTGLLISGVKVVSLRDKPGYPVAVIVGIPKKSQIGDLVKQRKGWKPSWKAFYWRYLEYGFTRKGVHYPAQPWLRPAMETVNRRAPQVVAQYVRAVLAESGRGAA
jgi:HK97 gp10 family phage protein